MSNESGVTTTMSPEAYLTMMRGARANAERDIQEYLERHDLLVPDSECAISCEDWRLDKYIITT